jgi:glutathione S-transferase
MGIKLYGTPPSPPSHSARLMLEYKNLDHRVIWLLPGMWPALLRMHGFRGGTVPAMKTDGRRIQGSTLIARALEKLKPDPPLFPSDPEQRAAVEQAERWGDQVLQDVPRRIVRWLSVHRPETKVMIAKDVGIPFPRFAAWINTPAARHLASKVDADGQIQRAVAQVPEVMDHVDELIAEGVIGGAEPNAADFQIASSVRALLNVKDLDPVAQGRPASEHAIRLLPEFGTDLPPGLLPHQYLAGATNTAAGSRASERS